MVVIIQEVMIVETTQACRQETADHLLIINITVTQAEVMVERHSNVAGVDQLAVRSSTQVSALLIRTRITTEEEVLVVITMPAVADKVTTITHLHPTMEEETIGIGIKREIVR